MLRYETLILTVPEITRDEEQNLEKDFVKLIKDNSGQFISYERWGKYRLAYPIRNNEYGVYFLARFEATGEKLTDLLEGIREYFRVKRHDLVMRSLSTSIDADAPLTYHRPQSLEEVPTRPRETMRYLKEARALGDESSRDELNSQDSKMSEEASEEQERASYNNENEIE